MVTKAYRYCSMLTGVPQGPFLMAARVGGRGNRRWPSQLIRVLAGVVHVPEVLERTPASFLQALHRHRAVRE